MKKQSGFTLIELMVSITVGLILLAGVSSFFVATLNSSATSISTQRFEQTVQILTGTITSEIRRAGYANDGVVLTANGLNGTHYFGQPGCILLSHSTPTNDEIFHGYLLSNGVVYVYSNTTFNNSCSLDLTKWTPVTDSTVIKVLSMTATGSPTVAFTLDAQAVHLTASDGSLLRRSMTTTVQMRNL